MPERVIGPYFFEYEDVNTVTVTVCQHRVILENTYIQEWTTCLRHSGSKKGKWSSSQGYNATAKGDFQIMTLIS